MIIKDDPFEDWGDFEITLIDVKDKVPKMIQQSSAVIALPPVDISTGHGEIITTSAGEKSCPACTFVNGQFMIKCEICGSNL